ncbi:putative ATP-dependent DNA helicase [Neospora caninum Liverpool]|uniref:DNA 3'-5' helicase n=1 Tax=Neospora caninum (strain Liverpool) TaxID=572307 RepID=F0VGU5_NEOCL|nr:putative ATP-dependent DNA helicase [Neospora caninum Liverpool]CBZ52939.1 putative ATP-dependent DNA helicase [Neospora caninum Liverpool]|eukprot:XP_003882971.1 putative ATP-dependent DNA helicase [Neospora caninum Liverpool]
MVTNDAEGGMEKKEERDGKPPLGGNTDSLKLREAAGVAGPLTRKRPESETDRHACFFEKREKDGAEGDGEGAARPGKSLRDESLLQALKNAFGYSAFREGQEQAVRAILEGKDALVIMPTGGGKSLTYLLPGLLLPGLVIIVSPLLALMDDQSSPFSGGASRSSLSCLASSVSRGKYKFLFVTPEQVSSPTFQRVLGQLEARRRGVGIGEETKENRRNEEANGNRSQGVALIAVDEAHCISTWGHDFRRSYRQVERQNLSVLRTILPETPLLACTATATPAVCADIQTSLALRDAVRVGLSFDRKNIFYEVRMKRRLGPRPVEADDEEAALEGDPATAAEEEEDWTLEDMGAEVASRHRGECGIVYCFKKATCDSVATALRRKGIPAQAYHAGLSDKVRCELQRAWMTGKILVLVATVAFGLGVDNPNVRFVFHHSLPKTMEGYYQESGRCGRDGRPAHALLYYSPRNFESLRYIMDYTFSQLKLYAKGEPKGRARPQKGTGNRRGGEAKPEEESEETAETVDDHKARLEHMERRYRKDLESLKEVRQYCEETVCRRARILNFFGESLPPRRSSGPGPSGRRGSGEAQQGTERKRNREATEQDVTSCPGGVKRERKDQLVSAESPEGTPSSGPSSPRPPGGLCVGVSPSERATPCMNCREAEAGKREVERKNHSHGEEGASDLSPVSAGISSADAWRCCDLCEQREAEKANGRGSLGKALSTAAPSARLLASLASRGCTRVSSAARPARSFPGGGMAAVVGEDEGGALACGTLEFEKNDCSDDESRGESGWYGSKGSFRESAHLRRTVPGAWCPGSSALSRGPGAALGRGKGTDQFRRGISIGAGGRGRVVYHTSAESATARQSDGKIFHGAQGSTCAGSRSERVSDAIRAKGIRAVMEELERQEQLAEEADEMEGPKAQSRFFRQRFSAMKQRPASEAETHDPSSFSSRLPFPRPRPASLASTSGDRASELARTAASPSAVGRTNPPARSPTFVRASTLARDLSKSSAGKAAPQLRSGLCRPRGKG